MASCRHLPAHIGQSGTGEASVVSDSDRHMTKQHFVIIRLLLRAYNYFLSVPPEDFRLALAISNGNNFFANLDRCFVRLCAPRRDQLRGGSLAPTRVTSSKKIHVPLRATRRQPHSKSNGNARPQLSGLDLSVSCDPDVSPCAQRFATRDH